MNLPEVSSVQIYFDGGAKPNPGRGYGSYEVTGSGSNCSLVPKKELRIPFGSPVSNNQAEYMALLEALDWCEDNLPAHAKVHILTDSRIVERQLSANWNCRKPHLQLLMHEARALLRRYKHWRVSWQPRRHNVARFGH